MPVLHKKGAFSELTVFPCCVLKASFEMIPLKHTAVKNGLRIAGSHSKHLSGYLLSSTQSVGSYIF